MSRRADHRGRGRYRFLDDVTVADVAFEAWGESLDDLFAACGRATFDVMVDLEAVRPVATVSVELGNETLEGLLFDWLDELIGRKDIDALVFSEFRVAVGQTDAGFTLKATLRGEPISARLPMRLDVKAPTAHRLEVARVDEAWRAHVVLDV